MATLSLPHQPNLEQLRKQARELQRGVRSGDAAAFAVAGLDRPVAGFALAQAQTTIARRYGFASWARLRRHVEAIGDRTWVYSDATDIDEPASIFLRLACLNFENDGVERRKRAEALRADHPDLLSMSVGAAAACADAERVGQHLNRDPAAARRPSGPYGWSPLMYAAYARVDAPRDAALTTVRLLLDAGADPNDGRFFAGLPTPFTVLTGVFGGTGEEQPPHEHALDLARLLLERGADPNDGQTLYNRMFGPADDFLEVLFDFGLGEGHGGPWRRRLPDLIPDPVAQLRGLLEWAVVHDQRARVHLLVGHGVDIVSPLPHGGTPVEVALRNGHRRLAGELLEYGAAAPALDSVDRFIAAALAGDAREVSAADRSVIAAAQRSRPALVVWAAGQERIDAVGLLVAAGFDVNALGRSDLPLEEKWQTALHTAVERDNAELARRLLDLGADCSMRDLRFDGTPLDWAHHLGRPNLVALLSGESAR
jgi:ankyrin repeat protein